tara:strand:- start:1022 stop:2005 length:984 start_codon:yes stop_codon:yes gene_type:complete
MVAFRSPGAVNTGGFINAAAAVGADAASFGDTTFKNSPDYDTISALTARGQGVTDRAGVKFAGTLLSDQQQARMDALTVPKILQRNQQKMAGELAARSQGWLGLINKKDPVKPFQYDLSEFDNILKSHKQQIEEEGQRISGRKYVPIESPKSSSSNSSNVSTLNQPGDFVGGQLPESTVKAIKQTADNLGVDVYSLGGLFEMESGHRPNVWGGDGGNFYGIIQWGGPERREAGLDPDKIANRNYTIEEQLPHVEKWLKGRGFKPGQHGATELYRTVLVGNPYESGTDSNLTNSDTAAEQMKPGGSLYKRAQKLYGNFQPLESTSSIE